MAMSLTDSTLDLLLAPVLVPGVNEEDIPQIVQFARSIGVGKYYPGIGIQNYLTYKLGRKFQNITPWAWDRFYQTLAMLERQTGYKPLILTPKNFGIHSRRQLPVPFRKGEKITVPLLYPGRVAGEFLAAARNRTIQVINVPKSNPIGHDLRVQLIRTRGNIFVAKPI